jgi:hypothetical protein
MTTEQRRQLLRGYGFFPDEIFRDLESYAEAWELHRDELMAEFIAKHRSETFIRPVAWWIVEHRRERPIVNPFLSESILATKRAELFGYLHTHVYGGKGMYCMQESEPDYLDRLGLLTDEEREFLAACDEDKE